MKTIETISRQNFAPYGSVIAFPEEDKSDFYIVAKDGQKPWRLACFRYRNHSIRRIECHPTSMESFEPLEGATLLLVAEHGKPEDWRMFLLDRPVILKSGIWHQTMALTLEASVKITENLDVYSEYYDLPWTIRVGAGEDE